METGLTTLKQNGCTKMECKKFQKLLEIVHVDGFITINKLDRFGNKTVLGLKVIQEISYDRKIQKSKPIANFNPDFKESRPSKITNEHMKCILSLTRNFI